MNTMADVRISHFAAPPDGGEAGDRRVVGIDLGTTNTKVALVAIGSERIRLLAVATARTPEPSSLDDTLRALLRRVLDGATAPEAVGVASMAESGVPLDLFGQPLGGWLRWDGHRAVDQAQQLSERLGWTELVAATGVRPSAKVPLASWAWLRTHRPDAWSAMVSWSGAADLACLLLTGRLATDHTLAGRTMAYRLPSASGVLPPAFDADLCAEVGLRVDQLPAVVPPTEVAGHVGTAFADCGLLVGTPVVVAGHDHAVGAFAAGVREPGDVADSLGTTEAIIAVAQTPVDPVWVARAGMSTVVTVAGDRAAILAGSSSAGAVIGWWLEHHSGGLGPEELFTQVDALDDTPSEIIVLPYLTGRQTPEPDPTAELRVLGRHGEHTPAQLARAMLEGLCLQARWMLQTQAQIAGFDPARVPVTVLGGAVAANAAWLRIKAAVLGSPLRVVTAAEPVAAGAALVAARRAGLIRPPELCLERRSGPSVPQGGTRYDEPLARFVAAATRTSAGTQTSASIQPPVVTAIQTPGAE